MSVEVQRATIACNVCGAGVTELRRGRCWACYMRWSEARPVGRGATCTVCFEKRRDQLRLVELHGRSLPLCHGCAARITRLLEIPGSVDTIRRALRRERRDGDRRDDKPDHRIFPRERRVGERRGPPRGARPDADPLVDPAALDDMIIELLEEDMEEIEQTFVKGARPVKDPAEAEPSAKG
jgi:hypothetical protein